MPPQRTTLTAILLALLSFPLQLLSWMSHNHTPEGTTTRVSRPTAKRPARASGKRERLTKTDIFWRLINGSMTWSEGRSRDEELFRRHRWPLYRKMQDLITELERLEVLMRVQDRSLTPAQQQLLNDLLSDLPIVEAQLEELGGDGGSA